MARQPYEKMDKVRNAKSINYKEQTDIIMIIISITWNEDSCHVEKLVSGEVEFNLETAVFAFVLILIFVFVFVFAFLFKFHLETAVVPTPFIILRFNI